MPSLTGTERPRQSPRYRRRRECHATCALRALGQALRGLVDNALDASPPNARVELNVDADAVTVHVEVHDHGPGMTPDIAARALEPFFTTKTTQGMGLGLFLAKTVVEQLGGQLELDSSPGRGTVARVELPRASALAGASNAR